MPFFQHKTVNNNHPFSIFKSLKITIFGNYFKPELKIH